MVSCHVSNEAAQSETTVHVSLKKSPRQLPLGEADVLLTLS